MQDKRTSIVLFSDHPAAHSGLARITRDLAIRIHTHLGDTFKVCTLGYGHCGSAQLPFPQYHWKENDWFIPTELPFIAENFANNEPFILFTIGDIQRFLPLADPQFSQDRNFAGWWQDQRSRGAKLWGYFPIDAHGKDGKLPPQLAHTLTHYDRVLVPSEWAKGIVERTVPGIKVTAIPHGIDTDIFKPYPREEARGKIGELFFDIAQWPKEQINVSDQALWIGIVATNQWRKDWALGIEVVAEIQKTRPVFLWAHSDRLKNEWSLLELISDFGLLQSCLVTTGIVSDHAMAVAYSAMDLTLGIGRGEGFGYPIAESLACDCPVFASSYGAQRDYLPEEMQIHPEGTRINGPLNLVRPLHDPKVWAKFIEDWIGMKMDFSPLSESLAWKNLWPRFAAWLREGL